MEEEEEQEVQRRVSEPEAELEEVNHRDRFLQEVECYTEETLALPTSLEDTSLLAVEDMEVGSGVLVSADWRSIEASQDEGKGMVELEVVVETYVEEPSEEQVEEEPEMSEHLIWTILPLLP